MTTRYGSIDVQPKHQLQPQAQQHIDEDHPTLAQTIRRFSQEQPTEKASSVEARRDVAHIFQIAIPDVDKILDNPAWMVSALDGRETEDATYLQR